VVRAHDKHTPDGDSVDAPTPRPEPEVWDYSEEALMRLAQTIPTEAFVRFVAAVIRRKSSGVPIDPEIHWKVEGCSREQTIPIPMTRVTVVLSELARDILEVLVDAEGWLNKTEIGRRMNPADPVNAEAGTFKRALDQLKENGLVETHQRKGFKAKRLD
jgi:ribosomal protein S19E (S16A)